jgi:rhomboid protease GluP
MDKRRMCPHCRAFITTSDRVCPYCDTVVGPRAIDVRRPSDVIGGFIPHARFTTSIILLINFGMFAVSLALSMGGASNILSGIEVPTLYRLGAKYGVFESGQWWRLVTAGFLHANLIHILMNSWVLFDVGAQVEEVFGAARMIVIYFAGSVFGFALSSIWRPGIPSVGASAGIMGLIGAMIALGVRNRSNPAAAAMRGMYIRWVFYMLLIGFVVQMIDQAAHIGGLVGGFCVAYVTGTPKLVNTIGERFWQGAAFVAIALTVVSFAYMLSGVGF